MKKLLAILITVITSMSFVRGVFITAGVGMAEIVHSQLSPKSILMVNPDGVHFSLSNVYLAPLDTNTCIMSFHRADSSISVIMAAMALKYNSSNPNGFINDSTPIHDQIVQLRSQVGANNSSISTNTSNIALKLNKIDSGRQNIFYATGYDLNKVRDSLAALIPTSTVSTSRTISTTSPLTGGGDLSANRTFAINNAAADNSTKGAATFDTNYFDDNGSGLISWAVSSGTGNVSANAVTINQPRGKITYASPSIAGAGTVSVTFTNSFITATSIINIGLNGNGSNLTLVNAYVKSQTAGSCIINIQNLSLLSLFNTGFIIDYFIVN